MSKTKPPAIPTEQRIREGAFLRAALSKADITQEQLANNLGVSQGLIWQWLDGKTPIPSGRIPAIANIVGIRPTDLRPELADFAASITPAPLAQGQSLSEMTRTASPSAAGPDVRPVRAWEIGDELPDGYVLIPRLSLELAAGNGKRVTHVDTQHPRLFDGDWIREKRLKAKYLVCMPVSGDSMEPWINDGDTVVVDRSDTAIRDGKPYAIRYGDELRIKHVHKRFDGGLILRSINPDYGDEAIAPADLEHVEILGLVVWRAG